MSFTSLLALICIAIGLCACTGQSPAPLKNSTSFRTPIKESCSALVFDGQVLSKKNVLNIFDCTGWAKKYPSLNRALLATEESSIDRFFRPLNHSLFSSKDKRKQLFDVIALAESRGELSPLAVLLEQSIKQHQILKKMKDFAFSEALNDQEKIMLVNIFNGAEEKNFRDLKATKSFATAFEAQKLNLLKVITPERESKIISITESLLNELSLGVDQKSWGYLSSLMGGEGFPIKQWATLGSDQDPSVLLKVIEKPDFIKDIKVLNQGIHNGIICHNQSNARDFKVDIGEELAYVVESLKTDSREYFEATLLHGLTKYFAFESFCEEDVYQQGLKSYYDVVKYAFDAIKSDHDYIFLKKMHQVYQNDHFAFLNFLETDFFAKIRELLIDLSHTNEDTEFNHIVFDVLKMPLEEDYETLSGNISLLEQDSVASQKLATWNTYWKSLSSEESSQLASLVMLALHPEVDFSKVLNLNLKMLEAFPDLNQELSLYLSSADSQQDLRSLLAVMSEDGVESELADFFSRQGLFELIKVLTKDYLSSSHLKKPSPLIPRAEEIKVNYVDKVSSENEIAKRACFDVLTRQYELNNSYYALVNQLPPVCLKQLGSVGFVGQIYLWMNASEAFFESRFQVDNYHTRAGVWSPGMLQFIFSAAIEADLTLRSKNGEKGLASNLTVIHRRLTSPEVIQSVVQLSRLVDSAQKTINLDQHIENFFEVTPEKDFKKLIQNSFSLLEEVTPQIKVKSTQSTCRDLSASLRVDPCLSNTATTQDVIELLRLLKRKNEKGDSLLKSLLSWVHPRGGIEIPFSGVKGKRKSTSFDEIIRFLMDLSDQKTSKEFVFRNKGIKTHQQGTVLDRLEVVIRDISFLNNFYGAYFKNNVAKAQNYRYEIQSSEKLLRLMDDSSGIFRTLHVFPIETKERLKNVRQTYASLLEVDDQYLQADGTTRSYGDFIQSLLAAITESSLESTQNFNPYQKPKPEMVNGHNGQFLTKVVEMSGLRHLARIVRARFTPDLSALITPQFKVINTKLFGRHDLENIQKFWSALFDQYLDEDRNQINLLISDLVSLLSDMSPNEQAILEEIGIKTMLLLSDERLDSKTMDQMGQLLNLLVSQWPEMREVFGQIQEREKLLMMINTSLDHFVENPQLLSQLINVFVGQIFTVEDLAKLVQDATFRFELMTWMKMATTEAEGKDELNWSQTFKAIFANDNIQWGPLKEWLIHSTRSSEPKLTLSLLLHVLGEKTDQGVRYKVMMDELFLNHRPQLEVFLKETFAHLHLISD